jgi:hypothetical protein
MTRTKKTMIGMVFVMIAGVAVLVNTVTSAIEDAGGVKQILIDTGKEIKEISKEIDKDT